MSDEWVETTLGEIALVNPKEPALDEDAPFIAMADVDEWGVWARTSGPRGSRSGARARGGDTLVARITPCLENGKIAMVPLDLERVGGSTEFIVLRATHQILPEFLFLWAGSGPTHHAAIGLMTGTTGRQRVSGPDIATLPITLPPIPVQRRIVDLMTHLDTHLANLRAEREALTVLQRVVLADTLIGESQLASPVDRLTRTTLGEIAEWGAGGTPKAGDPRFYEGGTIPWAVIGDVRDGYIETTEKSITEAGLQQIGHHAPAGAVLVTMYGTIGRVALTTRPMATNQAIAWAIPKTQFVNAEYLFYWLRNHRPVLDAQARGATQRNINRAMLKQAEILLPPLADQQAFVVVMRALDHVIQRLTDELRSLGEMRSTLLSDLLHGAVVLGDSYDSMLEVA